MTPTDFGRVLSKARLDTGEALIVVAGRAGLTRAAALALEEGKTRAGLEEYVSALRVSQVERGLLLSAANLAWGRS
jgi:hypothetical protein